MTRWKRFRKRAEVWLTRAGLSVIPRLPRLVVRLCAHVLGGCGYLFAVRLRRIGLVNLELALGDTLGPKARKRILKQSFRTFALVLLDVLWFSRRTRTRLEQWVRLDPSIDSLLHPGAAICITGHLGSWELMGHLMASHGYPLVSVAAALSNPAVEPYLLRTRQALGQEVLSRQGAVRGMLAALRQGSKVGLVLDQNTRLPEGGLFVDFFGLPATVSSSAARLALRTSSEICFGFCIPQADGHYLAYAPVAPFAPPENATVDDEAVLALTQSITERMEEAVRKDPEAWLWMYPRWKYCPPDADLTRHPFYARRLQPGQP